MKKNQGFTLIELLVVIAIIGILSSVVLASLNTARNKGVDSSVKAQLAGMRPEAEIYYDANTSYGTPFATATAACTGTASMFLLDTSFKSAITALTTNVGAPTCAAGGVVGGTATTASSWAMSAVIKTGPSTWCVDSTGASLLGKTALGGNASGATGVAAYCG